MSGETVQVVEQATHGVECYEAWRNLTDCPHEQQRPLTGPEEVEALVAALADLRNRDLSDYCGAEELAQEDVQRALTVVDFLLRQYRWMHHVVTVATRPPGEHSASFEQAAQP